MQALEEALDQLQMEAHCSKHNLHLEAVVLAQSNLLVHRVNMHLAVPVPRLLIPRAHLHLVPYLQHLVL